MPLERQPWYKDETRSTPLPFSLVKKISSNRADAESFRTIAFFPWTKQSLNTLWNGAYAADNALVTKWNNTIDLLSDAIAVGGTSTLHIFFTRQRRPPIVVSLPAGESTLSPIPVDCICIAWTLNPNTPTEPLVIFSHLNLIYIFNVRRKKIENSLRGHGGAITCIAVHPSSTHLFATTSRDYSTRIYDLRLSPQQTPFNPCWPPGKEPSLAGAPHGLHTTEREGTGPGTGRCIIVLMGGRSGGHQAAVLGAAFHPALPLIATCGLDRVVKIWHVPPASSEILTRQDKPLFSSSRIHRARVLSVSWLDQDLLLTHSAPAIMRTHPEKLSSKDVYLEPGQLVLWRWLSLYRFFPQAGEYKGGQQMVLRGCASDYQESSSFKVISAVSFPRVDTQLQAPVLHLHQSPTHDPVVLLTYPESATIMMANVVHMKPRAKPPFPLDEIELVDRTEQMGLVDQEREGKGISIPEICGWELQVPVSSITGTEDRSGLMSCAMNKGSDTIIGVGCGGCIWIWDTRFKV